MDVHPLYKQSGFLFILNALTTFRTPTFQTDVRASPTMMSYASCWPEELGGQLTDQAHEVDEQQAGTCRVKTIMTMLVLILNSF